MLKKSLLILIFTLLWVNCGSSQKKKTSNNQLSAKSLQENKKNPKDEYFIISGNEIVPGDKVHLGPKSGEYKNKSIQNSDLYRSDSRNENSKIKLYPIRYSGNSLLREVKRHRKRRKKGVVLSIIGNARVIHGPTTFRSKKIEVLGEAGDFIYVDRKLRIYDSKFGTKLTAGYGEYIRRSRKAFLKKSPVVIHKSKTSKNITTIYSQEMVRDFEAGITYATGNVRILYKDGARVHAKRATLFEEKDILEITGNPTIYEKKNVFRSEKMIIYNDKKFVKMIGKVSVFITSETSPDSKTAEVVTAIYSPLATYKFGETIRLGRVIIFFGTRNDLVRVIRPDLLAVCLTLTGRGEKIEEMDAIGSVSVLDKRDRTRVYSQMADFRDATNTIRIVTIYDELGIKRSPRIVFHNKDDIATGFLQSEKLTYNEKTQVMHAKGDVVYQSLEEQPPGKTSLANNGTKKVKVRNEVSLHGQWAKYYGKKKFVNILGNPYITQVAGKVFARKIVVFTEENRTEFFGSLYGHFGADEE